MGGAEGLNGRVGVRYCAARVDNLWSSPAFILLAMILIVLSLSLRAASSEVILILA